MHLLAFVELVKHLTKIPLPLGLGTLHRLLLPTGIALICSRPLSFIFLITPH